MRAIRLMFTGVIAMAAALALAGPAAADAQLQASPDPVAFGEVALGASVERTVTVTNVGDAGTTIDPLSIETPLTGNFGHFSLVDDGCSNVELDPLDSCHVGVRLTARALGAEEGDLVSLRDDFTTALRVGLTATVDGSPEPAPELVDVWGDEAGDGLDLGELFGLAVGLEDRIFVTEDLTDRIQRVSPSGASELTFGSLGDGPDQLDQPTGVATDDTGNVYVADSENARVQVFTADGVHVRSIVTTRPEDNHPKSAPLDIGVDSLGRIYVTDANNGNVKRYMPDGTFDVSWSEVGTGPGQLAAPYAVELDDQDRAFVSDLGGRRVQRFSADGAFQLGWGGFGETPGRFREPSDIAIDAQGRVYVTDPPTNRVQRFSPDGVFQTSWSLEPPDPGIAPQAYPYGIDVDSTGRIIASDYNGTLQVFAYSPPDEEPPPDKKPPPDEQPPPDDQPSPDEPSGPAGDGTPPGSGGTPPGSGGAPPHAGPSGADPPAAVFAVVAAALREQAWARGITRHLTLVAILRALAEQRTAPRATLARRHATVTRRRARVMLRCEAPKVQRCRGTLALWLRVPKRTKAKGPLATCPAISTRASNSRRGKRRSGEAVCMRVARRGFTLRAGQRRAVPVRLRASARARVREHGQLAVRADVITRSPRGTRPDGSGIHVARLTLNRPAR